MRICPTCKISLEGKHNKAKYCSRLCYRRAPGIKEKYAFRTKIYQNAHAREISRRYGKLKCKCTHENHIFSLSKLEYETLLHSNCYYCDKSLLNETGCSLDRKDCTLGYFYDNVLPCCGACNQIRNVHLTVNEMKIAMTAVLKYRKENQ